MVCRNNWSRGSNRSVTNRRVALWDSPARRGRQNCDKGSGRGRAKENRGGRGATTVPQALSLRGFDSHARRDVVLLDHGIMFGLRQVVKSCGGGLVSTGISVGCHPRGNFCGCPSESSGACVDPGSKILNIVLCFSTS